MIRRISVTQSDIDGSSNPLREAIKRKLFKDFETAIGVTGVTIFKNDVKMWNPLPLSPDAMRFWHDSDVTRKRLVPFKFLLDIPKHFLTGFNLQDQELEE